MVTVCIPTIGGAGQLTRQLVHDLLSEPEVTQVRLYDNSALQLGDLQMVDPRVVYVHQPGHTIYAAWNETLWLMTDHGAALILNDDLVIPQGFVRYLLGAAWQGGWDVLGVDPAVTAPAVPGFYNVRKVRGSYRHGGITGHAFMVAANGFRPNLQIDPRFEWWGGDDDLMFKAERAGLALGRCEGLGVAHTPETTASQHSWTGPAKDRDRLLLEQLWPGQSW